MSLATVFPKSASLDAEEIMVDIDRLEQALTEQFAYLEVGNPEHIRSINALRDDVADGRSLEWLIGEFRKILGLFVDGHSEISDVAGVSTGEYLPFLIEPAGERWVAFRPDRNSFVHPEYPYLAEIDGVALSEWLLAAEPYIQRGSPQFRVQRGLGLLRDITFLREALALDDSPTVQLVLENESGSSISQSLELVPDWPVYGTWFNRQSEILPGNIGYLRVADMDERNASEIDAWMSEFASTDGLIVDVRDNRGGTREALLEFLPHLMASDDEPRVANLAKYRLHDDFRSDHLESRFLYRRASPQFDAVERAAIDKFHERTELEWLPAEDDFSEWHYLVISREPDDDRPVYDRPVVVLTNAKSFSATDVFVAALKGLRNVTILGQPTGGGSGRNRDVILPHSGLSVSLASMASFQPSGLLYDGNGVEPDVLVFPNPADHLVGGRDHVLDSALQRLT